METSTTNTHDSSEAISLEDQQYIGQKRNLKIHQQIISASSGALITNLVTYPLDVIKARLQFGVHQHGTGKVIHLIRDVVKKEGIATFWSGLRPTLIMQLPASGIYITAYERGRDALASNFNMNYYEASIISGVASRTLAVISIGPLEYIRTTMQVAGKTNGGLMDSIRAATRVGGVRRLWQGTTATLIRDVPFSSIYWSLMEYIRDYLNQHTTIMQDRVLTNSFVSAMGAATVASLVTHPIDVIKTRMQGNISKRVTLTEATLSVYKDGALFEGLTPRLARVAPACAIMISSYELFKSLWDVN